MASTNFKLFDENKTNMMSDTEYNINTQRLNGVQAGIASSQLQNKTLHQTSLVAYSIAQIMMQNGYDANDSAAVSSFVGNMSNSLLQKILDKATSAEAQAGTITNKWISPATMKAAALLLSGGTMSGPINMGNNKITNLADPTDSLDSVNKKYVDEFVDNKWVNRGTKTFNFGSTGTKTVYNVFNEIPDEFSKVKFSVDLNLNLFGSTNRNGYISIQGAYIFTVERYSYATGNYHEDLILDYKRLVQKTDSGQEIKHWAVVNGPEYGTVSTTNVTASVIEANKSIVMIAESMNNQPCSASVTIFTQ